VDFPEAGGAEIVREALKFESRAAAHGERTFQQRLKRYNDMLPAESLIFFSWGRGQTCGRATIYTAGHLIEPTMRNVLAAKAAGIALAPKPAHEALLGNDLKARHEHREGEWPKKPTRNLQPDGPAQQYPS
jgi:hypothetical protein